MNYADLTRLLRANPDLRVEGMDVTPAQADAQLGRPVVRQRSLLTEHDMQASVIAECDLRAKQNPEWGMTFAVPNGGQRPVLVAKALKAEGVRPGVPDIFNLAQHHGYHGVVLELKVTPNDTTAEQRRWLDWLRGQGFYTAVVRDDPQAAINILAWYLEGEQ